MFGLSRPEAILGSPTDVILVLPVAIWRVLPIGKAGAVEPNYPRPLGDSLLWSVVSVVESVGHTPSESDESELGAAPLPIRESPPGSFSGFPSTHTREGVVVVSNPPFPVSRSG